MNDVSNDMYLISTNKDIDHNGKSSSNSKMSKKYSGKQVIKAGEKLLELINREELKDNKEFESAMDVLSYWRYSHESPLTEAVRVIEETTKKIETSAIFAKRLKRYVSIVNKLKRFKEMKLKNMQDIGGCRIIVSTPKKLTQVARALRKRPEFKSASGKIRFKDYIVNPKEDGYRGYHLVGQFKGADKEQRSIEVQLRTNLQHDWATALEIVDLFTGQKLKSNQGENDWMIFFKKVSEQFAIMETVHLFKADDRTKRDEYKERIRESDKAYESLISTQMYANKLNVVRNFEAYAHSLKVVDSRIKDSLFDGFALIEVNTIEKTVKSTLFEHENTAQAEKEYISAEKRATKEKGLVVALVSTTAVGGIREAYPNYFADSTEFLKHLLIVTNTETQKKRGFLSAIFG